MHFARTAANHCARSAFAPLALPSSASRASPPDWPEAVLPHIPRNRRRLLQLHWWRRRRELQRLRNHSASTHIPGEPNPGLAALLGLIPGVGAMYNGQYAKGVVHLIVFAILVSLADEHGIFGLFIAGWVCYQVIEAHHTARARRDGTPLPNPFGLNDLSERLGFGKSWPDTPQSAAAQPTSTAYSSDPTAPPPPAGTYAHAVRRLPRPSHPNQPRLGHTVRELRPPGSPHPALRSTRLPPRSQRSHSEEPFSRRRHLAHRTRLHLSPRQRRHLSRLPRSPAHSLLPDRDRASGSSSTR